MRAGDAIGSAGAVGAADGRDGPPVRSAPDGPPGWLALVAVVVGVAVTADVVAGGLLTHLDHAVASTAGRWDLRDRTWPLRLIYLLTLFGQRGSVLVVSVPTVAVLCSLRRTVDPAVRFLAALVLLTVAVYALKDATGRTAPPADGLHTAAGASFPSGHLANAVLVWGVVAAVAAGPRVPGWLTRAARAVRWVGPPAVVVGMTLLDYHWFSDFAAGACVGLVLLWLVLRPAWGRVAGLLDRRLWRPGGTTAPPG